MTGHVPTPTTGPDQTVLPNQPFFSWLRGETTLFISQIVAILTLVYFLASLVYYVVGARDYLPGNIKLVVDYTHVLFMALFVSVLIRFLEDNKPGSYRVGVVYRRVFNAKTGKRYLSPSENSPDVPDYLKNGQANAPLDTGLRRLRSLKLRFLCFWCSMLILYVFFACDHTYEWLRRSPQRQEVKSTEISGSLTIVPVSESQKPLTPWGPWKAYEKLFTKGEIKNVDIADEAPKFSSEKEDLEKLPLVQKQLEKKRRDRQPVGKARMVFSIVEFALNNISLWFVFWCFLAMFLSANETLKEMKYCWISGICMIVFTLLFPIIAYFNPNISVATFRSCTAIFDALSGTMNAVVVALLIARLDSKLIGLSSRLIGILYSYAAIQPLFVAFAQDPETVLEWITTSVLVFVLISKIYFFLIIMFALQTGRMLNYLICFPVLRTKVEQAWPAGLNLSPEGDSQSSKTITKAVASLSDETEGDPSPQASHAKGQSTSLPDKADDDPSPQASHAEGESTSLPDKADDDPSPQASDAEGQSASLFQHYSTALLSHVKRIISTVFAQVRNFISQFRGFIKHVRKVVRNPAEWIGGEEPLRLSQWLGLRSIGAFVFILIGYAVSRVDVMSGWTLIDGIQIIVVVIAIKTLHQMRLQSTCAAKVTGLVECIFGIKPAELKYPLEEVEDHVERFKKYFLWFWYATLGLYVVLLCEHFQIKTLSIAPSDEAVEIGRALHLLAYPFLKFLLASLNLLFIFWCFVVLQSPAYDKDEHSKSRQRQRLLIYYSSFVVGLLISLYALVAALRIGIGSTEGVLRGFATIFAGITGTLSGVALALLVARLDSKLFGLKPPLTWILFAYAAIQPLFVVFELEEEVFKAIVTVVLLAALGLKVCFFLVIANTIQSRKMLIFLVCFPFLRDRVNTIFENQFEIRTQKHEENLFTFSIWKKNKLAYSSSIRTGSRRECDGWVERIRTIRANEPVEPEKDSYWVKAEIPRPVAGTYWVEIRDSYQLLCESGPLKSKEEAEILVKESSEMIPWCKYNRV